MFARSPRVRASHQLGASNNIRVASAEIIVRGNVAGIETLVIGVVRNVAGRERVIDGVTCRRIVRRCVTVAGSIAAKN